MKNIGKLVLGNLLVLTLFSGCKGEGFRTQSASSIQNEREMKTQEVKAKIENEIGEAFDDNEWEYVDASEWHEGRLRADNEVSYYRDNDKIFVMYHPGFGMSQYVYDVCFSLDGGKNWTSSYMHGVSGFTELYFVNDTMIMADSIGMSEMPDVWYSNWNGEFSCLAIDEINKIAELPMMDEWTDISFIEPDAESNQITMQWYPMGENQNIFFYKITLNLDTMEKVSEDDPYGLLEMAEDYADTGYIYANSSNKYLDEIELNAKYMKLMGLLRTSTGIEREIRCAINEIYARKGYDFTGTDYEEYFSSKDWYHPIVGKQVTEEELNSYEKANIDLLVKIEKEMQAATPDKE